MRIHAKGTLLCSVLASCLIAAVATLQPARAQMRPASASSDPAPAPLRRIAPVRPLRTAPAAMTPVQGDAPIIRVTPGMRPAQVLGLRDEQVIETPSGHRMRVADYRRLQAMFANARARSVQQHAAPFAILPAPMARGVPRRPGESAAQLLARPSTDVVRLASGHDVSVAQLRAIAPYVEQRYHVRLATASAPRPSLAGPATRIAALGQLHALPANAPDAMILESPNGTRVTVGEIRAVLRAQQPARRPVPRRPESRRPDSRGGMQR